MGSCRDNRQAYTMLSHSTLDSKHIISLIPACSDAPISCLQCQVKGWKEGGHKAACKLLARAKALPPADPDRRYVVQIKLVGLWNRQRTVQLPYRYSYKELAARVHQDCAVLTASVDGIHGTRQPVVGRR